MIIKNHIERVFVFGVCSVFFLNVLCCATSPWEGDVCETEAAASNSEDGSDPEPEVSDESDEEFSVSQSHGAAGIISGRTERSPILLYSSDDEEDDLANDCGDDCEESLAASTDSPVTVHELSFKEKLAVVNSIMRERVGCQRLHGKYAVVGDIHGDVVTFSKLIEILQNDIDAGNIHGVVFLGDFWDRLEGGGVVFEQLIGFVYRNNIINADRIVVLRGNHETDLLINKSGNDYTKYKETLPPDVRIMVDDFYNLIPFNVIINDDTYLAHGGLPAWFEMDTEKMAERLLSRSAEIYPKDIPIRVGVHSIVFSSAWSDFVLNIEREFESNFARCHSGGCEACRFGESLLDRYSYLFDRIDGSLKIRNYIFGHDHNKGAFTQSKFDFTRADGVKNDYSVTTVISSPYLTFEAADEAQRFCGSVALVTPGCDCMSQDGRPMINVPQKYIGIKLIGGVSGTQIVFEKLL